MKIGSFSFALKSKMEKVVSNVANQSLACYSKVVLSLEEKSHKKKAPKGLEQKK